MDTKEPARYTVINKHLVYYRNRIEPNPFEATKAYVIAHAEGKLSKFLPYEVGVLPWWPGYNGNEHEYSLQRWYMGLSSDNPPARVDFSRNPKLFRELVEPLDFSKPYDSAIVESIRAQFKTEKPSKQIEVDAVAIVEAENE